MENQERDLQRNLTSDGDAVERAYQDGINTEGRIEFRNYETYAERIAFRDGWMTAKKNNK